MSTSTLAPAAFQTDVGESVSATAWSSGADLLAVADLAGSVTLLDSRDGSALARGAAHAGGAFCLAWRPAGQVLASAGADGMVSLLDVLQEPSTRTEVGGWVGALAWSPDSERLAVAAGRSLVLLHAGGAVLRRWDDHPSTVTDVVWSRDGSRVGCASYGGVHWYTVASSSSAPVRTFDWKGSLLVARVSPDGRWVASGNQDASVHVWKLWSGDDAEMTGYDGKVDTLAFDRTSRWMANGGTTQISLWDFSGRGPMGRSPRMLPGHDSAVTALAWQPTGDLLASAGRDGGLAVWAPGPKARHVEPLRRVDAGGRVTSLSWSPDGSRVVAGTVEGAVVAVVV